EEPDVDFESQFVKSNGQIEKKEPAITSPVKTTNQSIAFPSVNGLAVTTQPVAPSIPLIGNNQSTDPKTSQAFMSVFADPFAAAPVNPATIQQHYQMELQQQKVQQQQQQQQIMLSPLLNTKVCVLIS
ncbi:unnamed protein product, partial [Trichobilharzia regenti]